MNWRRHLKPKDVLSAFLGLGGVGVLGIIAFVIGSITLAIVSSVIYDLLKGSFGDDTGTLLRILITALLILAVTVVVVTVVVRFWMARRDRPAPGPVQRMPAHRALIAFVSLPPGTSHENAVDHHQVPHGPGEPRLDHVILFHSEASQERAWEYRTMILQRRDGPRHVHPRLLEDLYDLRACYKATQQAITDLLDAAVEPPLTLDDIVIEATGGTAIYSAAATLVALDRSVALEYIEPALDPVTGRPNFANATLKRVDIGWVSGWAIPASEEDDVAEGDVLPVLPDDDSRPANVP